MTEPRHNAAEATAGVLPQKAASAVPGTPAGITAPGATPVVRQRSEILFFALRDKKLLFGSGVVLVFLVLAVVGPMFARYTPLEYTDTLGKPPSGEFVLGTTLFGQDVYAQFVNGLRSTFIVGLIGGGLAAIVGMTIGFVAGYRGGWIDEILNMVTNVFLVIPTLALLLVIASYLSARGIMFEAIFVGLTSWPWAARAIRAQTFSYTSRDFVDLARLSGLSSWRIMFREIAPNMGSYLFMTFILLFGGAILIAATLDFIGLGPTEGMSLGLMMNNAVHWNALQLGLWWWFIPPGIAITAIVGSLYVMNVGLDEIFNPRLRDR